MSIKMLEAFKWPADEEASEHASIRSNKQFGVFIDTKFHIDAGI
jgi:hypothetical protein